MCQNLIGMDNILLCKIKVPKIWPQIPKQLIQKFKKFEHLSISQVKEEFRMDIKIENWKAIYQSSWVATEVIQKIGAFNAQMKNEHRIEHVVSSVFNSWSMKRLREWTWGKEGEIIKRRKTTARKTKRMNKNQSQFFEKINNIGTSLRERPC